MPLKRGIVVFLLIIVLSSSSNLQINAVDTGELYDNLEPIGVSIPVEIKLWNFDSGLIEELNQTITRHMVQESIYPKTQQIEQWQIDIDNQNYGLTHNINLTFTIASHTETTEMINTFSNITTTSTVDSPVNPDESFSGKSISRDHLDDFFEDKSDLSGYTIHLTNFTFLDNYDLSQFHWFNLGRTSSISFPTQDMRNIYDLADNSLVFDPTGIAPYFGVSHSVFNSSGQGYLEYTSTGINSLIEQVIVGSPQTNNQFILENEIRVDRIVIGTDSSDYEYNVARSSTAYSYFDLAVSNMFPHFDLRVNDINVVLSEVPTLQSYLEDNTIMINGEPTVIVDFELAETFKTEIRAHEYPDFPDRYYYGIFLFADQNIKFMMNLTNNGEITNELVEYNTGEIGFTIDSLQDWYLPESNFISIQDSLARSLKVLGLNFGLPGLSSNYSMQVESPMSSYGISNSWDNRFTDEEINQVQRRIAATYGQHARYKINSLISSIDSSVVFWHDTSDLEQLRADVEIAQNELNSANYSGSIKMFFDILKNYEMEELEFQYSINALNYGSVFILLVILLGYWSRILVDESISKEEFKRRVYSNREFQINKQKRTEK